MCWPRRWRRRIAIELEREEERMQTIGPGRVIARRRVWENSKTVGSGKIIAEMGWRLPIGAANLWKCPSR